MFYRNEIRGDTPPGSHRYPWHELEEYLPRGGMWATPSPGQRPTFIYESSRLMADPPRFYRSMLRALDQWPRSVAQALTTPGLNQRAWLGHAGCFLETGSPEETTRLGWHELDEAEQYGANLAADDAIAEWRRRNREQDPQLNLFGGDDA
jgi:hypothetical protein